MPNSLARFVRGRHGAVITVLVVAVTLTCYLLLIREPSTATEPALFITAPDAPSKLTVNPEFGTRFAPGAQFSVEPFSREKPKNEKRIVLVGSANVLSCTDDAGAPLKKAVHHWLRTLLPDKSFEVINVTVKNVDSSVLLHMAPGITSITPDMLVVAVGDHEFDAVGNATTSATVPFQSEPFMATVARFRIDLNQFVAAIEPNRPTLFLTTLTSNDRDQIPLSGTPVTNNDAWDESWLTYRAALESDDVATARAALLALIKIDDAANTYYALGELELNAGNDTAAREAFIQARDRDAVRTRAPSAINDALRAQLRPDAVQIIDLEAAFRAHSPHGIIGRNLMANGVSPNANGCGLAAEIMAQTLAMALSTD